MFGKQDKKIKAILRFSGDVSITGIAKEIENELSIHTYTEGEVLKASSPC